MAGIMHYSNFFRFMETAEHGFFRSLGTSIVESKEPRSGLAARGARNAISERPSILRMRWKFTCWSRKKKSKALSYTFIFRKLNATPPVEVAHESAPADGCLRPTSKRTAPCPPAPFPNPWRNKSVNRPSSIAGLNHTNMKTMRHIVPIVCLLGCLTVRAADLIPAQRSGRRRRFRARPNLHQCAGIVGPRRCAGGRDT